MHQSLRCEPSLGTVVRIMQHSDRRAPRDERLTVQQGRQVLSAMVKVLVIDDADRLSRYGSFLTRSGLDAEVVTDPMQAIARLDATSFDVVVCGAQMCGMTGFELIARMGRRIVKPRFVLICQQPDDEVVKECLERGAAECLAEPVDPPELFAAVTFAASSKAAEFEAGARLFDTQPRIALNGGQVVASGPERDADAQDAALLSASHRLASCRSVLDLATRVTDDAVQATRATHGWFFRTDDREPRELDMGSDDRSAMPLPSSHLDIIKKCVERKEAQLWTDEQSPGVWSLIGARSILALPLRDVDNVVLAVVLVHATNRSFTNEDLDAARSLARRISPWLRIVYDFEKLATRERNFRALVEKSADVVWAIDLSGRVRYVNAAFQSSTGFERQNVISKGLNAWFTEESAARLRALLASPDSDSDCSRVLRVQQKNRDGGVVDSETSVAWIRDRTSGAVVGMQGILRDLRPRTGRRHSSESVVAISQDEPGSNQEPAEASRCVGKANRVVLLVEDEDIVRRPVVRILRRLGYEVLVAESGESALRMASEHHQRIDVLLTDLLLPGMNGAVLARKLRMLRPEMKIVYSSGCATNPPSRDVDPSEADAFISKPYSAQALARTLLEVLD